MTGMRVILAAVLALLYAFGMETGHAAEQIRVLLFQNIPRITVKSERGLVVRFANGEERLITAGVDAAATGGGIRINGTKPRSGMVLIRSRRGDITLTMRMTHRSPGTLPSPNLLHAVTVGGAVQIVNHGDGLQVINRVEIEEYVKGVVPAEMNALWHAEALKVQAVATRTYAIYQRMLSADREYDVMAGTQDQVYRGRHGVDQRVEQAVESTRGLVVTYENAPILAAFSSTAAGPTEDAMYVWAKDLPYLKGVDCPFDANSPYFQWRTEFTVQDLERSLRQQGIPVGTVASLTPYSYSRAGRVDQIRILHSDGELVLRGQDLRRTVGYSIIPSTQFEIESMGALIVLSGRGAGHAVGLCQWGAKELAEQGHGFEAILNYYFPGTEVKRLRAVEPVSAAFP